MPRVPAALLLALLALPLVATPMAEASEPPQRPSITIPTQQEFTVGGLNVTTWVMHDPTAVAYSPTPGDVQASLANLWNYDFSAGSPGVFYVKFNATEGGSYYVEATIGFNTPHLKAATEGEGRFHRPATGCAGEAGRVTCTLNGTGNTGDFTYRFVTAIGTPRGPLPVTLHVEVFDNTTGEPQALDSRDHTTTLQILDPVPPYAAKASHEGAQVASWVQGGIAGITGTGCLGTFTVAPDTNVSLTHPAKLCVVVVPPAGQRIRFRADMEGPDVLTNRSQTHQSEAFDATTSGAPASAVFNLQAAPGTTEGPMQATVRYTLERDANGTWVPAGQGELQVPFVVSKAITIAKPPVRGVQWLAQAPVMLLAIGGLAYIAVQHRQRPKIQPRSQALRAEMAAKTARKPAEAEAVQAEIAEQQKQEVREAAWEKKRKILDAKREDVLKSIRLAEERAARGEITDHVLRGIKERKERQLEQIQHEIEELR